MIATGVDADDGLFPLAFAIVESKNGNSWACFLACIREKVTNRVGLAIISDRHRGLERAIPEIFPPPIGYHPCCLRHLADRHKHSTLDMGR